MENYVKNTKKRRLPTRRNRRFPLFIHSSAYKSATISQYKSGIVTTDNTVLLRV